MLDNFSKVYSKYSSYIIIFLVISNIITFFQPQLFLNLFNIIIKLLPKSLINYFENINLTAYEALYIFALVLTITGFTTIWRILYHLWFSPKYMKILEKNQNAKYPKFHMDSIYNFMTEISTLFFLILSLLTQTEMISINSIKEFSTNFLSHNILISALTIIGIVRVCIVCMLFIIAGLGTVEQRKQK